MSEKLDTNPLWIKCICGASGREIGVHQKGRRYICKVCSRVKGKRVIFPWPPKAAIHSGSKLRWQTLTVEQRHSLIYALSNPRTNPHFNTVEKNFREKKPRETLFEFAGRSLGITSAEVQDLILELLSNKAIANCSDEKLAKDLEKVRSNPYIWFNIFRFQGTLVHTLNKTQQMSLFRILDRLNFLPCAFRMRTFELRLKEIARGRDFDELHKGSIHAELARKEMVLKRESVEEYLLDEDRKHVDVLVKKISDIEKEIALIGQKYVANYFDDGPGLQRSFSMFRKLNKKLRQDFATKSKSPET